MMTEQIATSDFTSAVAADMQEQRVEALKTYRRILNLKAPSAADRARLIDAMRTLGKDAGQLRKDVEAMAAYEKHTAIVADAESAEAQLAAEQARKTAEEYFAETERIAAQRAEEYLRLNDLQSDANLRVMAANKSRSVLAYLAQDFAEVLGIEHRTMPDDHRAWTPEQKLAHQRLGTAAA